MVKKDIEEKIEIPEGVEIKVEKEVVTAKGPKGEVSKNLLNPKINIAVENNFIVLVSKKGTKREKRLTGTFKAHI